MCLFGCNKSQKLQTTEPVESTAEAKIIETEAQAVGTEAKAVETEAKVVEAEGCAPSSKGAVAEVSAWVDANNALGLALLRAEPLQECAGTIVSPYSVQRALGMVLEGACGETAAQMRTALFLPDAENLSRLGSEVEATLLSRLGEDVTINIDNRLWVEKTFTLAEDYLARVRDSYRALPEAVDFINESEASRKRINDAVAKATNDRIKDILPNGSVSSLTRLVLTNAVFFKAPWEDPFNARFTRKGDFAAPHGTVQVDMMHQSEQFSLYTHEQFMSLVMPYVGRSYGLLVILPNRIEGKSELEALGDVEARLTPELLRAMIMEGTSARVDITLPKFKIEADLRLKDLLTALGMKLAFETEADFSRMAAERLLFISEVFHKAFIEVNEEGTEAAAATAVSMKGGGVGLMDPPPPIPFIVDRPFAFAIVHQPTGTVLFMGRVTDPTKT